MRILITGGAGSLGQALTRICLDRGDVVCVFSRSESRQHEFAQALGPHDNVRFFLGDVRDRARLEEVMGGCDAVIHCLDRHSPVTLANGERMPISTIVRDRLAVKVRSWDGREFRDAEITGWYENHRGDRRMVCLSWDGGQIGGARRQLWLTEDHRVLTSTGWRPAGDLVPGDAVLTGEPAANERQLAFLAGTLLGDSSLVRRHRGRADLTVSHATRQEEWITLKADILGEFGARLSTRSLRTPIVTTVFQMGTRRWASLGRLAALWYPEKKKRMPLAWLRDRLRSAPALVLAAWYLDDGYLVPRTKTAILCTDGFEREDIVGLADLLRSTTGISPTVVDENCGNGIRRVRLRCSGADSDRLFAMIGRGIPGSMRYKAPPTAAPYDGRFWDLGRAESHAGVIVKTEASAWTVNQRMKQQRVFCLSVSGTETFVAGGLLVHNCAALKRVDAIAYNPSEVRKTNIDGSANVTAAATAAGVERVLMISSDKAVEPTNDYGVSKAQMEHEAIASNAYTWPRGTRVACTRWGNVIGSTGSVIHVFRRAVAMGLPLPITDPECTRFWLTVEHAAAFALAALEVMEGGEIFVPILPSMRLGDLAEAIAPGHRWDVLGLRPGGEKRHELLINDDEAQRTVAAPSFGWLIKPAMMFWRGDDPWPEAPFPPGATYRSDVNEWRLTIPEMRKLLEAVP